MSAKHYKGDNYLIEQYTENVACISLYKPFVEDFSADMFKREFKALLKPILAEYDMIDNNYLLYVDYSTEFMRNKSYKHNDIKIQIHLKFLHNIKFKEKLSIINKFIQKIIAAIN
jgi:hypothetical protein